MKKTEAQKHGPVPRLRFPEFRDAGPWEVKRLGELIATITPPKKIQTNDYQSSGQIPIIDQSPTDICGWTDDETALIETDFPVVIFGDHSCVVKLAESPFAQGADGIKILSPSEEIDALFLFRSLQANPVEQKGYNRHFSALKEKLVPYPRKDSGEQEKIADFLTSLDDMIRAEGARLAALKDHKRGLMQRLFPRPEETAPRLRFPEFCDAGQWEVKRLGEIADVLQGFGFPERYQGKTRGKFPFYKVSDISNALAAGSFFIDEAANYVDEDDLKALKVRTVPSGATIFAKIGEAIRSNRRAMTTRQCVIDNNTAAIKSKETQATDLFLFYLFSKVELIDYSGGVVPSVNKTAIENIAISCPDLPEQRKIADCLSSLDDLIRAQGVQCETLQAHKRGLMQQLFPQEAG